MLGLCLLKKVLGKFQGFGCVTRGCVCVRRYVGRPLYNAARDDRADVVSALLRRRGGEGRAGAGAGAKSGANSRLPSGLGTGLGGGETASAVAARLGHSAVLSLLLEEEG